MSDQPRGEGKPQLAIGAGAAGAGGGTLLALLANNLPPDNSLRSWLIILAPSATVAISAGWIWLRHKIERHYREKELKVLISQSKQTLQEALANPNTSENHRRELRKQLEQLELIDINIALNRVKSLSSRDYP